MESKRVNSAIMRQQFETLVLPHLDAVYTAALRLAGNSDDAKDLLQDTILRAYRFFHQFTPGTNCRAWLMTILYNNFKNYRRHCSRHPTTPLNDEAQEDAEADGQLDGGGRSLEDLVAQRGIGRDLEAAINALPHDFREAMLLVDVHELSYPEVAVVLKIPLGTVKSRVSRARAILRVTLRSGEYARGKTGT
jgi:RNA polymerase sigma-70 factor, ECF subfamily